MTTAAETAPATPKESTERSALQRELEQLSLSSQIAEIEHLLEQMPEEPTPLSDFEKLTTEKDIDKALSKKFSWDHWASSVPDVAIYKRASYSQLGAGILFALVCAAASFTLIQHGYAGYSIILTLLGGVGCWIAVDAPKLGVYRFIRNKKLMKDKYYPEVTRLRNEHRQKAEAYEEQKKTRKQRLAQAQEKLEMVAVRYASSVPDKTLSIDEKAREVVVVDA